MKHCILNQCAFLTLSMGIIRSKPLKFCHEGTFSRRTEQSNSVFHEPGLRTWVGQSVGWHRSFEQNHVESDYKLFVRTCNLIIILNCLFYCYCMLLYF